MVFLRECANAPHVFTLANGNVLRIGPLEDSEPLAENLISDEVRLAERMGLVAVVVKRPAPPPLEPKPLVVPEEKPSVPTLTTPHPRRGGKK